MADTLTLGFLLFKAVEAIVTKIVESAWEPAKAGLQESIRRRVGKDEESKRSEVFAQAVATARQQTIKETDDFQKAEQVLKLIDDPDFQDVRPRVAEEAAKIMLFSDTPDIDSLTKLLSKYLGYRQAIYAEAATTSETVTLILSIFFKKLRSALLDLEPYKSLLIQHEILRSQYEQTLTLKEISGKLSPEDYDNEEQYRQQVAVMNRELGFVGIPELKDSSPITIKDIFVRLRASRESNSVDVQEDSSTEEHKQLVEKQQTRSREEILLDEAFKEASYMVILGDPGAGKTTLLKHLTVICAEGRAETELGLKTANGMPLLPIFVSLRAFEAEASIRNLDYGLIDYFCTYSYENLGLKKIPPRFFQTALDEKLCIVCLDGLDEVGSAGNRAKICDAVIALANRFPGNHYIVTSRIVGYQEAPLNRRDFIHYTISELQDDDIRDFVTKWYTKREPDEVQRKTQINTLINTIQDEPRIQSLARNPLLLTIITLVHRIEAELPNERVKLYDKCVTALVETWEKVKGLTIEEKQRPFYKGRRRLLEQLAYELHTRAEEPGQVQKVKKGTLELMLAGFLQQNKNLGLADDHDTALDEAKAFVSLIKGRTGLLIEIGEGVFSFPHLTFQEYLAACDIERRYINKTGAIWEAIKEHLHNAHWQEVILLLLGSLNRYDEAATELVQQILEAGKSDKFEPVLHRHLYLVARALADRVDVAMDVRRQAVDELLAIACDKTISWERKNAFAALSKLEGNEYAIKGLLELAQNQQREANERRWAAESLGELKCEDDAVQVLLELAQNQQLEANERRQAAESLGKLQREDDAAQLLLELAQNQQLEANERRWAAESLGELKREDNAAQVLLELAQNQQLGANQRRWAAESLGKLKREDDAAQVLLELVQNQQLDSYECRRTVESLIELKREDQAVQVLLKLLKTRQFGSYERRWAIQSLLELNHQEQALQVLLELLKTSQINSYEYRRTIDIWLELNHQDQAAQVLLELAQNQQLDASERRQAAENLGKLNYFQDQAAQVLLELAQNQQLDASERRQAAENLGKLNYFQDQAAQVLLELAQNQQLDASERRQAAENLGKLNYFQDQAAQVLLELAQNQQLDASERRQAAENLGKLNYFQDQAAQVLLELAQNQQLDASERRQTAENLGKLNYFQDQAAQVLLELAQNQQLDASERRWAAKNLRKLNYFQDQVAQVLLELAQNQQLDASERRWAAESLGELNHFQDQAAQVLLELVQSQQLDSYERQSALENLLKLNHQDQAAQILLELLQSQQLNAYERRWAINNLLKLNHQDQAAQVLLELVQSQQLDSYERQWAIENLLKLNHQDRAEQILLELVQNQQLNAYERQRVADSLKQILSV
ncbi:NACHT domain-containing protein [Nostoc sp. MS1]|uniref:NACHT domain-containing protein n=1 Tax=Nostoc sp. MS1 TaxID=2764711 RepID=UPI001CC4E6CE|nr:NACHT domain-containing protein [Nostoc sp. MS1]BCL33859.1 hypothetical protein NSMS1_03060 [Nostoc sp. MS1]